MVQGIYDPGHSVANDILFHLRHVHSMVQDILLCMAEIGARTLEGDTEQIFKKNKKNNTLCAHGGKKSISQYWADDF